MILVVVGVISYLGIPLYFPGYSTVNSILTRNHQVLVVSPGESKTITNLEIRDNSSALLVISNDTNVNISLEEGQGRAFQAKGQLSVALPPGDYNLTLVNTGNSTEVVSLTYGVFNTQFISNFYYTLQIFETFLEFTVIVGIGIVGWFVLSKALSKKR